MWPRGIGDGVRRSAKNLMLKGGGNPRGLHVTLPDRTGVEWSVGLGRSGVIGKTTKVQRAKKGNQNKDRMGVGPMVLGDNETCGSPIGRMLMASG